MPFVVTVKTAMIVSTIYKQFEYCIHSDTTLMKSLNDSCSFRHAKWLLTSCFKWLILPEANTTQTVAGLCDIQQFAQLAIHQLLY